MLTVLAKACFDRLGQGERSDSLIEPLLTEQPSLGMKVRWKRRSDYHT